MNEFIGHSIAVGILSLIVMLVHTAIQFIYMRFWLCLHIREWKWKFNSPFLTWVYWIGIIWIGYFGHATVEAIW